MHELALCQSILAIVEGEARARQISRVTAVQLEVGAFCCASPDALAFCFDAVMRGSIADGARLEMVPVPGRAWCIDCAAEVPVAVREDPCPRCGGRDLASCGGDALRVSELEVA
jgi:hydrogenase nickel incorporation protein HypA/HybF